MTRSRSSGEGGWPRASCATISPPDGVVMYVLQGMRIRPGPITDLFMGVLPYDAIYCASILLFMVFPGIVLWLPSLLVQ